jgi:NAD-dependent dihydropyrimidine dehydrogenase PreA subunit
VVKKVQPKIDYNKCVGSLECYDVCPVDVFDTEETKEGKRAVVARPDDCIECEQCIQVCPTDAVELVD